MHCRLSGAMSYYMAKMPSKGSGAHCAWAERQALLKEAVDVLKRGMLQVGLTVAGGGQDATLGGAPFHAQALTALGLSGAGASLEIAFGGDPPVDGRLLVRQLVLQCESMIYSLWVWETQSEFT